MADLSASETRTVFEDQRRIVGELQERLAEKEFQVIEGEKLRKKLHNTILVNKYQENIYIYIYIYNFFFLKFSPKSFSSYQLLSKKISDINFFSL